jgi:phosphatidylglycerophosphate synthase
MLARPLLGLGVTANSVTLTGLVLALLSGFSLARGDFGTGFALAMLAVLSDLIDGAVARASKAVTPFGDQLDAVVDRVVEGALLVGLSRHYPLLAPSILTFSMLVSYIKARVGLIIVADNSDWPGVGDRADRVVLLLLAIFALWRGWEWPALWLLRLLLGMTMLGSWQRLQHSRRLLEVRA